METGYAMLNLVVLIKVLAADRTLFAVRVRFIQQSFQVSHSHARELEPASMQHIQHHFNTG